MTITEEKYVLLTTQRKNGVGVPTPVWIAPLPDGRSGFTTDLTSGKVKRIRNNATVTLQPCTVRGKVAPGAVVVTATATVVTGADAKVVEAAIHRKYPLMTRLMGVGAAVAKVFRRSTATTEPCAVILQIG